MALVPVTGFWSKERSITTATLATEIAGSGPHPRRVLVEAADLPAVARLLGVEPGANVEPLGPGAIRTAIARDPRALGLIRAADVTPGLRALAVDGAALFGAARRTGLAGWPLLVPARPDPGRPPFDPGAAWTLAAGGDVMLDREVYRLAVLAGRGADYPWDGGTAKITGRTCCGWGRNTLVTGRRTGHAGAVRELLRAVDLSLVNLEGPAPDDFTYHPHGYVFTMDPALLAGLDRAGIDVVSLGDNHISNAGASGVADTIRSLERLGIAHAGAGRDLAAARRPALLTAGGLQVAVLAADGIAPASRATSSRAGAAPLRPASLRADIRAARRAGADLVIVVPHWGREYTDTVTIRQRRLARAMIAAGADVVLGGHSHWAGPLELIDGRLVVYSMGDLVFDLQHDARTQQGLIVELTFVGRRLAQVDLHPTLILEASQPNLLSRGGGGERLLRSIRAASARLDR